MSDRSFGNDIGNTKTMTASTVEDVSDVSLAKTEKGVSLNEPMEKTENGRAISRLPKPLAIEVYTKVHNSTLSKDLLMDELEDLVDEKYFPGETLLSSGKEFVVVSSEKRGGLTTYTMEDGSKIGHRDLKRKKGLSVEEIKQIAIEDAELTDGKIWKVREELLKEYPIREIKKFAPIFTPKSARKSQTTAASTSDSEAEGSENEVEVVEEGGGNERRKSARAAGTPAANRKVQEKQRMKEQKEKEKAERKEKEKEEKRRKKEEEKEKKVKEKEEKAALKAKKNGTMDKFVRKGETNGSSPSGSKKSPGGTASIFSPSKWGERRVASGVKKLEDAWKKRDQEAYLEACGWCEKNLSGAQQRSIDNPIWKFSIQKLVDKSKDRTHLKTLKGAKRGEYKAEMAEKRKETYREFEPRIKAWFSEVICQDDLLLTAEPLELQDAQRFECDEEMLKCIEITQFFVSMRKILLWNENISAEQLRGDLHEHLVGFRRSTYKMIANLLETALQEKEHEKTAHCNARISEFPITEHTITELVRAFFVGNTEMSLKTDRNRNKGEGEEEEGEEEDEVVEEEEKKEKKEEDQEEEKEEKEEDDEEERDRQRILGLFSDPLHIYEWTPEKQLEVLYALKGTVHGLPIIREWFMKDANSDQLTGLKANAVQIGKKIEKYTQELADLPMPDETTEIKSRQETREQEKMMKKRQGLEQLLDGLKDELEENREATARERDDLERIFRVPSIGTDRHLRKYYWFAYSKDAGIWVQDFGTTAYEKWVRLCAEKNASDVETGTDLPEYTDLPISIGSESSETWYKLCTEQSIRGLEASLKKNGRREKALKKYLENNMNDILASLHTKKPKKEEVERETTEERSVSPTDSKTHESSTERTLDETAENGRRGEENGLTRFSGPFASLKATMSELLADWQQSGITKIGDLPLFETRMDDAKSLEEMKLLVIELVTSVPQEVLIEKFPQAIAIAKKCFSHLKIVRFVRRLKEATNSSCLHMLLAYFDARIDSRRTLPELPCFVCRKKTGTNRKLMCKQCTTVYHHSCHRPAIDRETFDEEGFKESWLCVKCKKEARRQELLKKKAAAVANEEDMEQGSGGESSDEEDALEEENPRSRNAKRKANVAMRDVLEFEGVLRKDTPQAPPPPKKAKKEPIPVQNVKNGAQTIEFEPSYDKNIIGSTEVGPWSLKAHSFMSQGLATIKALGQAMIKNRVKSEVRELFESIEKANPRLYKVLQNVPSQSRSLRNTHHETQSLIDIEENLDVYTSAEQLKEHLGTFFQAARGYIETHNSRKLDEFDSLISELNFI